ncbi:MAG: methionine--tRNA ligase [Bryobacteraceae bacterium]|nr:methionine--tRNA ligase [Bryobacteraceae bacterium]
MKYYLTTPIYYVNAAPHIGHAYTTIAADALKRFKQMQGRRAVLTTGSDEHGINVERAAERMGQAPGEFVAVIAKEFKEQWEKLGLGVDRFMRTSDPRHHKLVAELFERCKKNGYVYKGSYTGQYCIHDNLYVNEAKPGDPCPECGRPTETVTEENYFFKLSAFQDRLLRLYEEQPEFIQPDARRNEVIAFVKQGLNDLSITRTNIKWGIPVPGEEKHVFYVWFDALMTYMSAVAGEDLWPADLHLIGKEIVRFHAIYWPAFLMAAEWPLPKRVFAHGWLLFQEDKMSKSKGNIVRATPIQEVMGVDALRYFLLREIVFGQDGNFSYDALVGRYNSDLANGLGNFTSRTLSMIGQYRGGKAPGGAAGVNPEIEQAAAKTIESFMSSWERFDFSRALEAVWAFISMLDKFIVEQAPWNIVKNKDAESQARLDAALYTAAEALRIVTALLAPAMPQSAEKIWALLGMKTPLGEVRLDRLRWGQLEPGQQVHRPQPVFPRIDAQPAIEKMRELEARETARQAALLGKSAPPAAAAPAGDKIGVEEFAKVDLRVGEVRSAERVKGADKLLHLKVDIGEAQPRTIVAGIAEAYAPEQLIGRRVVIVANLQPRKLRGIESNGMIVAAVAEGGKPVLVGFHEETLVGSKLR